MTNDELIKSVEYYTEIIESAQFTSTKYEAFAYEERAKANRMLGRYAQSLPDYRMCIQLTSDPERIAYTYYHMGCAYGMLSKYNEARSHFRRAYTLTKNTFNKRLFREAMFAIYAKIE